MPFPRHCASPSCTRTISLAAIALEERCATSQKHSPMKTRSSNPARNWGVEKRSRVKNPPISKSDCFTMSRQRRENMNDPGSGPASESNLAGPPSPSLIQSVFIGPAGLRAGWRFAIYLLACFVLLRALSLIIGFLFPRLQGLWALFAGECQLLVAAIVPAGALSRVERRPFGSYGLSRERAFGAFFWAGALWGLVSITVLLVAMRGFGAFYFGGLALHGVRILKFAAFWGVLFLI